MTLYEFNHFVQLWLFPPGLILWLMLLGFLLGTRWSRAKNIFIGSAFVLLWLLSTPIIAQWLIDSLQHQFQPLNIEQLRMAHHDSAIIILGSGVENADEYKNKHTVSDRTLSRLHYAAYLHQKTKFPIIVSGGNRDAQAHTEGDIMQQELANNFNIHTDLVERNSRNTEDESQYIIPILKQYQIKTIYVVTNAWHMPRSMFAFQRSLKDLNVTVIAAPMGYSAVKSDERVANYLPLLKALNISTLALHEYIGLLWYRLFYRS